MQVPCVSEILEAVQQLFQLIYAKKSRVCFTRHCAIQAHNCIRTCPYPGIPELLEQLRQRGLKLAVVSNKPDETTRTLAARFFPGVTALGQRDGIPSKPAPEMVWSAMEQLGADARHALYVGDSEVDVEMARRAGLPLAAVAWGFRGRALLEQAGARCIVDTVPELLAVATE